MCPLGRSQLPGYSTQRCPLASKEAAHRYPPITRTFFPDGSFDLEWVDTSLRMVDL